MLDNLKQQLDECVEIINKIFTSTKNNKISLNNLTNEFIFKELILEIEPYVEEGNGLIELLKDTDFPVRYSNWLSIIHCITHYLDQHPEKSKFVEKCQFKHLFNINDILKNDKDQTMILADLLLVLTVLSSKKDLFLDTISTLEENLQLLYLKKIENYIMNELDEGLTQRSEDNSANFNNTHKRHGSILSETKIRKLNEMEQYLKKDYGSQFIDFEEQYLKKIKELELKNHEYLNEIDAMKKANEKKLKDQETFLSESIIHNNLQHLLILKENEINEIKKEHELLIKKYVDENHLLKENVDFLEEKIMEYNELKNENEKLRKKAKELEILKEKMLNHEKSILEIQNKNSQIDALTKEKQNYLQSVDKLQKDIISEKDKARAIENERRKLENEIVDLKRENINLIRKLEDATSDVVYNEKDTILQEKSMRLSFKEMRKKSSMMLDQKYSFEREGNIELTKALEKIKLLENEINNLKTEKNELSNNYKEQVEKIHVLLEEKDKIFSELDTMRVELNKTNKEKEKINIEKEKLILLKNKYEKEVENFNSLLTKAENDKSCAQDKYSLLNNKIDEEKEILFEEKKKMMEKIDALTSENIMNSNELEFLKHQQQNSKTYIEKLETTNRNLFTENQNFQIEIEKLKYNNESLQKTLKEKKSSFIGERTLIHSNDIITNFTYNSFVNSLDNTPINTNKNPISPINNANDNPISELMKSEINTLKLSIIQKDESIKSLKEKIKIHESETKSLRVQLSQNVDKLNVELKKRNDDLDFYKKSYDEQKLRINQEHELISASLYELALQFMSLKNELSGKASPSSSSSHSFFEG